VVTKKGSYIDNALHSYCQIPNWDQDKHALLGLARCYQEMGQYGHALKSYLWIPNWMKDKQALLGFARCYEEMGQYDNAFNSFKQIPNWMKDKQALLGLARCYQEMGAFYNALHSYGQIPNWDQDKQVLLSLARCYEKMSQYDNALKIYGQIPNGGQDKQALLSLARCYQKMGQYDNALKSYWQIPNWSQDKQALLGLGHLYEIIEDDSNLSSTIPSGVSLYPYCATFLLMQIRYFCKLDSISVAQDVLMNVQDRFPYSTTVGLNIIHFHLLQGDICSARAMEQIYKERFYSHSKFLRQMDMLFQYKSFSGLVNLSIANSKWNDRFKRIINCISQSFEIQNTFFYYRFNS